MFARQGSICSLRDEMCGWKREADLTDAERERSEAWRRWRDLPRHADRKRRFRDHR
jgi:hypothetical protein